MIFDVYEPYVSAINFQQTLPPFEVICSKFLSQLNLNKKKVFFSNEPIFGQKVKNSEKNWPYKLSVHYLPL